jgi:hypothetical protein
MAAPRRYQVIDFAGDPYGRSHFGQIILLNQ